MHSHTLTRTAVQLVLFVGPALAEAADDRWLAVPR